jgi:uncharacterized membrane protein YtjA (UPF0391 family)
LASLLSAVADGVSLLGCSPQCNANIRPFAIALHCYSPSLDNLQLGFEFTPTQCRSRSTHKCENRFGRTAVIAETRSSLERLVPQHQQKGEAMGNLLYWAVVFLVVALVAAVLGFGGVAGTAMAGAQMLFWVAIVLFVISLIGGLLGRGRI